MLLAQNTNAIKQASPLRRQFAIAVWITIAGGGAQFHVDFTCANLVNEIDCEIAKLFFLVSIEKCEDKN